MIRQRFIVIVAVLAAVVAAGLGTFRLASAAGYTKIVYSPTPIAAPGALAVNEVVTIQVTLETGTTPAPGAAVFLSFTHVGIPGGSTGGTAFAGNGTQIALNTTPTSYTADSSGIVRITYTAPAALPTAGHDTRVAHLPSPARPAGSWLTATVRFPSRTRRLRAFQTAAWTH
jgi:hypothetical protein